MDFRRLYEQALAEAGSTGGLSQKSFDNYLHKYSKLEKSEDITKLINGKIFTFFYTGDYVKGTMFINRRPLLFLCIEPGDLDNKLLVKGIDLMLLHPIQRLNFLIRVFTIYGKTIEKNNLLLSANTPGKQMPIKINQEMSGKLFDGINYKHAYSGFKIDKIQALKEIPTDDWVNIVYLNTKSIEGTSIEEIYKKYK